jgi:hypothetical protein
VKAKLRDLTLLFGSFVEICCRIVFHPLFEDGEHLGRSLSRCADDEDAAELIFVAAVCLCEREFGSFVLREDCVLLLCRPAQRFFRRVILRVTLADARMAVERLLPVLGRQGTPDGGGGFEQSGLVGDRPSRGKGSGPCT